MLKSKTNAAFSLGSAPRAACLSASSSQTSAHVIDTRTAAVRRVHGPARGVLQQYFME